jgi:hypothetical protein
MVVSHAIQDGEFTPSRYYSINAAVPREAYSLEGIGFPEKRQMVEKKWKTYWDYNNPDNIEPPLKHLFAANWHQLFVDTPNDARNKLTWKKKFSSVLPKMYNFYSAGDEVVRDPRVDQDSASVLLTIADRGIDFAAYAWAAQEYLKGGTSGATFAMPPILQSQAGWGFNINQMNFEMTGNAGHHVQRSAIHAATIPLVDLVLEPFVKKFNEPALHNALMGETSAGSNKSSEKRVIYDVLSRGIPAMSFAGATHRLPSAKENFDMQGTMRTDANHWPTEGRDDDIRKGNWLHSDMRDVALLHVYKIYQQFITTGNLNEN